ncbi:MAG: HAMP domain-containing histidine kinase [Bacteroides sp.]|nr:HAMP domain-containing histidine kinase [Bacteroides sp.]MCM1550294.1 HAMP domain-containing histidine kinase [Clostridium sp.]
MSFKLKVLITNIMLMAVSLGVIGYLMIHNSYRVSMDMQMDRAMEEHQMVVSAVESAVVDFLVNDSFHSMEQIGEIGEEIAGTVEGTGTRFCFLDGDRQCIYSNGEELNFNKELLDYLERGKRNYTIEEQDSNAILTIASLIRVNDSNMYLVNQRDISDIYRENEKQIRFFQIIMIAALIICGGVISVISWWLTKTIEQLNNTASVIASGDYSVRTRLVSNDEIGELAEKFDSMAEAIEDHVQELKDHARQQEDFVASFTHEIKTPMTAIIGYADMLRSKDMEEEQQILTANYIFQEGKRLESMSLKLFDLIALKRENIEKQKIYTQVFGEEIENSILPILERAGLSFSVNMQPAVIEGDRELLKTVFINLIDNARKASKPGDEIRMRGLWNREAEDATLYEIQIQDDGCGIPEEEVDKICEAFYMVDKSRARKQGGAGLGLATTSLIIEVHRGRFLIESTVGKGTTMHVLLPGKEMDTYEA